MLYSIQQKVYICAVHINKHFPCVSTDIYSAQHNRKLQLTQIMLFLVEHLMNITYQILIKYMSIRVDRSPDRYFLMLYYT